MRKILHINIVVLMAIFTLAGSARAYPTLQSGYTDIKFTNVENWVDVDQNRYVSEGDLFYGIAWAKTFTLQEDPTQTSYWSATTTDNLSAYFLLQVSSVVPYDLNTYTIGFTSASSDPNGVLSSADLAAGIVQKWYTDTKANTFVLPDLNPANNSASVAHDIAQVIDGSAYASLTMGDGYWFGLGLIDPSIVGAGGFLATNYSGLNVTGGGPLAGLIKIANTAVNPSYPLAQVVGQSQIIKTVLLDGWMYKSEDPMTVATPEPATMLIVGTGLMGLFAARRRQRKP